jgi:hypothetical protein
MNHSCADRMRVTKHGRYLANIASDRTGARSDERQKLSGGASCGEHLDAGKATDEGQWKLPDMAAHSESVDEEPDMTCQGRKDLGQRTRGFVRRTSDAGKATDEGQWKLPDMAAHSESVDEEPDSQRDAGECLPAAENACVRR